MNSYYEVYKNTEFRLTRNRDKCIGDLVDTLVEIPYNMPVDIYGTGEIINNFEQEMADLLGKEKAVFFPSGTMAQQIAMRIWCDEIGLKTITYHPLCHLEIHEKDGIKELHNIKTILLGESHRLFTLEDLKSIDEKISTLLIELPQREIGGVLPTWDELLEISKYCKEKGIKLHLDGARLFESVPFYDKTLNDICSIFDSVYISFYKGLGGIAGAILAGDENFIEKSKIWKRRHGGDLISLYPYIISAKYNYNQRKDKMNEYWESAKYCAKIINTVKGIRTEPLVPMCNMFHVHFDYSKDYLENILEKLSIKYNLGTIPYFQVINENSCKTEMSFGDNFSHVDKDIMEKYFYELNMEL